MTIKDKRVIFLIGPTSSGKTSLALKLSKLFDGEILSIDSRQMYIGLDQGSGKIPISEDSSIVKSEGCWKINNINIWGYDAFSNISVKTAVDFANFVENLNLEKPYLFCTVGTGFYADILLGYKNVNTAVINSDLRKSLENLNTQELLKILESHYTNDFRGLDVNNKQRLIRAIEKAQSSNSSEKSYKIFSDNTLLFGLNSSNDYLFNRVDAWVEAIFNDSLFDEYEKLKASGCAESLLTGLVYKNAAAVISGNTTCEIAKSQCKYSLHSYIRRQKTYFKKMTLAKVFDIQNTSFDNDLIKTIESIK